MKRQVAFVKLSFVIVLICSFRLLGALNVVIIESQSIGLSQDMDVEWKKVATSMGHLAAIVPQSALDSETNFLNTDILIVSSGEIGLSAKQINTILKLIMNGKPVYLQTEHSPSNSTNQAFEFIIRTLGGSFNWKNEFMGDLVGIKVTGSFKSTDNNVSSLKYYWYSVSGQGDCRTIPFLEYQGEYHGFQYIPYDSFYGSIITTTDQDWIRESISTKLMQNILTHLISPTLRVEPNRYLNLGSDTVLCLGDTLILDPSISEAIYKWNDGSTNKSLTVVESGEYGVEVIHYCGVETDEIKVNFISAPSVKLCCENIICQGETLTLDAYTFNGSYLWNDGSIEPILDVEYPGNYWVKVDNGCAVDTVYTLITLDDCKCSTYIPNTFTPNGDNINDYFLLFSNCTLKNYKLLIFDRWGSMVFESINPQYGWDGTRFGRFLSNDVYSYYLTYNYNTKNKVIKYGEITLLR